MLSPQRRRMLQFAFPFLVATGPTLFLWWEGTPYTLMFLAIATAIFFAIGCLPVLIRVNPAFDHLVTYFPAYSAFTTLETIVKGHPWTDALLPCLICGLLFTLYGAVKYSTDPQRP